jgi:hypothetical protein
MPDGVGKTPCNPLQLDEHPVALLVAQVDERVRKEFVVLHDRSPIVICSAGSASAPHDTIGSLAVDALDQSNKRLRQMPRRIRMENQPEPSIDLGFEGMSAVELRQWSSIDPCRHARDRLAISVLCSPAPAHPRLR